MLERCERLVDQVQQLDKVIRSWLDEEDSGEDLLSLPRLAQSHDGCKAVRRVVVALEFLKPHFRSVVEPHRDRRSGIIGHFNVLIVRDVVDVGERLLVISDVAVALGRTFVVVESDARRDDVEQGRTTIERWQL